MRTRIVLAVVGIFAAATALILGASYLLIADHLRSTLPAAEADAVLRGLLAQYGLAVVGMTLLGAGAALLVARRLLARLTVITQAAARTSGDQLGERLALDGPQDEVRELGDTFDAMLDRLQESITAQRRFIANASHELRSPLTAIRTEVEVTLSDGAADAAELRAMGARVLDGADELEQLLAALLLLARSQGSLIREQPVDLAAIVREAAAAHTARTGEGRIALRGDASPPLLILGDGSLLTRLAANLLDNATRYGRARSTVRVELSRDHDHAQLVIANPGGVPVPPGEVERLREPFQRAERGHAHGSGLGLSIVQAVAEAHRGTMQLAALAEGGLEVRVRLPLARRSALPGAPNGEAAAVLTNS